MITKRTNDFSALEFEAGEVVLIDKEAGWTSFDVVKKLRNIIRVKKVGHAGTLDPFATGLLIVCTGKMTKKIGSFQQLNKTYSGVFYLGKRTDTMDPEGKPIEEGSLENIDEQSIFSAREKFLGTIRQIPPMFSAKKHKGKSLYKYARKGIEVEREPVNVEILKFEIDEIELPRVKFTVESSKGTYIRVLADDFGKVLGCGAYLEELRRLAIGEYEVADALRIDEFEERFSAGVRM